MPIRHLVKFGRIPVITSASVILVNRCLHQVLIWFLILTFGFCRWQLYAYASAANIE